MEATGNGVCFTQLQLVRAGWAKAKYLYDHKTTLHVYMRRMVVVHGKGGQSVHDDEVAVVVFMALRGGGMVIPGSVHNERGGGVV